MKPAQSTQIGYPMCFKATNKENRCTNLLTCRVARVVDFITMISRKYTQYLSYQKKNHNVPRAR